MATTATNLLTSLSTDLGTAETGAVSALTSFFSQALVGWGSDEAAILKAALDEMISKKEAGSTWEEALTAAYNLFYNDELAEGQKVALQFLNVLSSIAQAAETIL